MKNAVIYSILQISTKTSRLCEKCGSFLAKNTAIYCLNLLLSIAVCYNFFRQIICRKILAKNNVKPGRKILSKNLAEQGRKILAKKAVD